jgi:hypothetical protein
MTTQNDWQAGLIYPVDDAKGDTTQSMSWVYTTMHVDSEGDRAHDFYVAPSNNKGESVGQVHTHTHTYTRTHVHT